MLFVNLKKKKIAVSVLLYVFFVPIKDLVIIYICYHSAVELQVWYSRIKMEKYKSFLSR